MYKEEGGVIGDANGFRSLRLLFSLSGQELFSFLPYKQECFYSDTRNTGHGSDTIDELKREYGIFEQHLHIVRDADSELFRFDHP